MYKKKIWWLTIAILLLCKMAGSVVEKKYCNLLIVGKCGAGKTSIANALLENFSKSEIDEKVFSSSTKSCLCKTVEYPVENNVQVTLKVIDTVGLFDTDSRISNEASIEVMKKFVRNRVPEGISLVIFVMKKGRFTKEEEATFMFIMKKFRREISNISALCITNTELDKDDARQSWIAEFQQDTKTRDVAEFMQKGIYTVGFPSREHTQEALWPVIEPTTIQDRLTLKTLVKESCELYLAKDFFEPSFWDKCRIF